MNFTDAFKAFAPMEVACNANLHISERAADWTSDVCTETCTTALESTFAHLVTATDCLTTVTTAFPQLKVPVQILLLQDGEHDNAEAYIEAVREALVSNLNSAW